MGFRLRNSINIGAGFRINISGSGIGYSRGIKGYRITKTAKGTIRRTVSIPGTGISYVEETGKRKPHQVSPEDIQERSPSSTASPNSSEEIVNSAATETTSEGLEHIIVAVRTTLALDKISTIGIGVSLIASCFIHLFVASLIAFIALKIYVRTAGSINLDYEIDDNQQKVINQYMDEVFKAADSERVWRIMESSTVTNKKYSWGATNSVERVSCKASRKAPFPFKPNIPVASFTVGKETLVFFPDKLFIMQKGKLGAINYADIETNVHTTRFVENEEVPDDAVVVGSTWEYTNKSGGPDKRFRNNPEYPICMYGEIELKSASGLNTILMYSKADNE